jgi:membrane protein
VNLTIVWRFITSLWHQFFEDHCHATAAALTYQTLFAIVPLLTLMYTVFSMFEAFSGLGTVVEEFLFTNIVPENIATVQEYLRSFSNQARQLSLPSVILLASTAVLMLSTIEKTLNEIWRVREPRHGFQRLWMYWAVLTLGPLMVGCGLAISTYIFSMPLISDVTEFTGFLTFIPWILSIALFTLIYVAVPNCAVSLKFAFAGGVAASIVFELAKVLFGILMAKSDFAIIYGTFAAVPLLLVWIYLCWMILLIGAEFVKLLSVYPRAGEAASGEPLFQVLRILDLFRRAHSRGDVLKEKDVYALSAQVDLQRWSEYRTLLIENHLLHVVDDGALVLSKDLNELTVWDFYRLFPWPMPCFGGGPSQWETSLGETFRDIAGHDKSALSMSVASLLRTSSAQLGDAAAEAPNEVSTETAKQVRQ